MISGRNFFLLVSGAMIIGLIGFCWGKGILDATQRQESNSSEIIDALLNQKLEIKKNSCQTNMAVSDVDDFISSYVVWSFQNRNFSDTSHFQCNDAPIRECSWSFGKSSFNESWSTTLNFKYDATIKKIVPQSLACIDTP